MLDPVIAAQPGGPCQEIAHAIDEAHHLALAEPLVDGRLNEDDLRERAAALRGNAPVVLRLAQEAPIGDDGNTVYPRIVDAVDHNILARECFVDKACHDTFDGKSGEKPRSIFPSEALGAREIEEILVDDPIDGPDFSS